MDTEKNTCNCGCCDLKDNCKGSEKSVLSKRVHEFIEAKQGEEHSKSQLIAVLHMVQDDEGYLSQEAMDEVAYLMQIPAAKVSGVASFYHYFRLKKKGKFVISVCLGTACYVKGAERVLNKFREELGIDVGETTSDGVFSLEVARCLGACALAPVVKIGNDIHQLTPDQVPGVIEKYLNLAKENN